METNDGWDTHGDGYVVGKAETADNGDVSRKMYIYQRNVRKTGINNCL